MKKVLTFLLVLLSSNFALAEEYDFIRENVTVTAVSKLQLGVSFCYKYKDVDECVDTIRNIHTKYLNVGDVITIKVKKGEFSTSEHDIAKGLTINGFNPVKVSL